MKIAILLPYKENFSSIYPGCVNFYFICNQKVFKKNITVFSSTTYKYSFKNYVNIKLNKNIFQVKHELIPKF